MLEKQSLDEFLSNINKGKVVIVSLSPQSRASLAVHFGISPLKVEFKFVIYIPFERTRARRQIYMIGVVIFGAVLRCWMLGIFFFFHYEGN